jgi:ferritin-like metal-binding protein YciE
MALIGMAKGRSLQRRWLLAGLRDAHAAATVRTEALRRLTDHHALPPALGGQLAEIAAEAEEQLHRLEHVFAILREHPGGGEAAAGAELVMLADTSTGEGRRGGPLSEAAIASVLQRDAAWGAEEHEMLLHLAHAAGLYLAARLLDLTLQERRARAQAFARLAGAPFVITPPRFRSVAH